jgi:stage II sporulation protein AA (anti-sigma F factor antagonist)
MIKNGGNYMIKQEKIFTHKIENDALVINLSGEIDHHSAVGVRSDIDTLVFETRPKRLILELSDITFMDSSGLGLIMGRYALIKDLGGSLLLRSPSVAVMKILGLSGMDRIISIEKTKEEGQNDDKK